MKLKLAALSLAALVLSSACSVPDRVRGHILQPTDRALPAVQDNLVILDVRVATEDGALKLHDVNLKNTATGLPWRVPLFANSIMKTKTVPFEEKEGAIYHTIVLDMPAGEYQVTGLEFRNSVVNLAGTNLAQSYQRAPPEPLYFAVRSSSEPQYLGMLDIAINPYVTSQHRDGMSQILGAAAEARRQDRMNDSPIDQMNPGGTDAMLGAAATAYATEVQTLGGALRIAIVTPDEASSGDAGKRFRALAGKNIAPGRMWLQPASAR